MGKICFGVDLGGTTIKMGLFDSEKGLLEKWEILTRKEEGGSLILGDIADSIHKKIEERKLKKEEICGVGMGVPGPVTKDGVVHTCVNLGWGIVNVGQELEKKVGLLVKVANDANVAALGELWQGGGKGYTDLVMVTLGTGVGGGIILDGKIVPGTHGAAGEIGHMPVVYEDEDICNCGKKGCLERAASATGIVKTAKRILAASDKPSVLRNRELSAKIIFDAYRDGDEIATEAAEYFGKYLGIACADIASVVDPQVFVLGGGVSKAGEVLIKLVSKYYNEKAFTSCREAKIVLAELGNEAGIYGAAKMVLEDVK